MKTNSKHEVIARIAGPGLVLAALLAMVLSGSSLVRAQASATSPTVPAAAPAKAAPAAQAGQSTAPSERKPGGNHEGIHVHGHWTIEVRNPDGKLVSHTEFENSLASNGGATLLAGLLTGTVTPGSWQVYLASDSSGDGAIVFAEPNSTAASQCQAAIQPEYPGYQICYDTLSVTGSQLGSSSSGILVLTGSTVTFTGSASLPSSFPGETIAWVETEQEVCSPSNSPSACFNVALATEATSGASVALTARNLGDGVDSDPPSVPVSAGQALSVTVVISFSSGS